MKSIIVRNFIILILLLWNIGCTTAVVKKSLSLEELSNNYFEFSKIEIKNTDNREYAKIVINGKNKFLFTTNEFSNVKGYKGKTNLLVMTNENLSKLEKVIFLNSEDTKSYVNLLEKEEYYNKFSGIDVTKLTEDSFSDIDAVSCATITSNAIKKAISTSLLKIKTALKQK